MLIIKAEPLPGDTIRKALEEAANLADINNCIIELQFNNIPVYIRKDSNLLQAEGNYMDRLKSKRRRQARK